MLLCGFTPGIECLGGVRLVILGLWILPKSSFTNDDARGSQHGASSIKRTYSDDRQVLSSLLLLRHGIPRSPRHERRPQLRSVAPLHAPAQGASLDTSLSASARSFAVVSSHRVVVSRGGGGWFLCWGFPPWHRPKQHDLLLWLRQS